MARNKSVSPDLVSKILKKDYFDKESQENNNIKNLYYPYVTSLVNTKAEALKDNINIY